MLSDLSEKINAIEGITEGDEPKVRRTQPLLVTFVQSILAFKRLAKTMRKWKNLNASVKKRVHTKSTSSLQIQCKTSDVMVRQSAAGVSVINMPPDIILKVKAEEQKLKIMRLREENKKRMQAFMTLRQDNGDNRAMARTTTLDNADIFQKKKTKKRINLLSSFTERLDSLQTNLDRKLAHEMARNRKSFNRARAASNPKHDQSKTTSEDLLLKNLAISGADATPHVERFDYMPGTTIYFGSSVAIQARHGGFLSFDRVDHIKSSAHKIMNHSKFLITNADDPTDLGLLRYGDAVWLMASQHEVLGAQYIAAPSHKIGQSKDLLQKEILHKDTAEVNTNSRKIRPVLVNSRGRNQFKAHQYGRWIVLNKERTIETLGEYVTHLDHIMLEQGWYFLSSSSPWDAHMKRHGNFEDLQYGQFNVFDLPSDAQWTMQLIALPNNGTQEVMKRQHLVGKAKDQMEENKEFRWKVKQKLNVGLEESLPVKATSDGLMVHTLSHKLDPDAMQLDLLKKYLKFSAKNFATEDHSVDSLAKVYGSSSLVVYMAKLRQIYTNIELGNSDIVEEVKHEVDMRKAAKRKPGTILEQEYWNIATKVLLSTRAWSQLDSAMHSFVVFDMTQKVTAAAVLLRFFRSLVEKRARWKNVMNSKDVEAFVKIKLIDEKRRQEQEKQQQQQQQQQQHGSTSWKLRKLKSSSSFRGNSSSPVPTGDILPGTVGAERSTARKGSIFSSSNFSTQGNFIDTENFLQTDRHLTNETTSATKNDVNYETSHKNRLVRRNSTTAMPLPAHMLPFNIERELEMSVQKPVRTPLAQAESPVPGILAPTWVHIGEVPDTEDGLATKKKQQLKAPKGLPRDVRDSVKLPSMNTSMKFLRHTSSNPNLYDTIKVVKKSAKHSRSIPDLLAGMGSQ
jgi:hypothetical protein